MEAKTATDEMQLIMFFLSIITFFRKEPGRWTADENGFILEAPFSNRRRKGRLLFQYQKVKRTPNCSLRIGPALVIRPNVVDVATFAGTDALGRS